MTSDKDGPVIMVKYLDGAETLIWLLQLLLVLRHDGLNQNNFSIYRLSWK